MLTRFYYLLLLICFCGATESFAQFGPNLAEEVPKVIPPSPNASAIEKFGIIPVDYSTGVPNISQPLWNWKRGRLSLNLQMAYHAGGHKIQDMAPNTGLGWALAGIGRISRSVKGIRDDKSIYGYMNTPALPLLSTTGGDGWGLDKYIFSSPSIQSQTGFPASIAITPLNSTYSATVKALAKGELDAEQDVFSYSLNGQSGRFVIDKNRDIIPLEFTKAKFEMDYNSQGPGEIESFTITDDKGIVYKFEYKEYFHSQQLSSSSEFSVPTQDYTSSWLLTQMIDPTTSDIVTFQYVNSNSPVVYETGFSESQVFDVTRQADFHAIPAFLVASDITSFNVIEGDESVISAISLPDGSNVNFEYDFQRDDLKYSSALTKLKVKNLYEATVRQFEFHYSYFLSGTGFYAPFGVVSDNDYNKRLRLDRIDELSNDGTSALSTIFTYNSLKLETRNSQNIDYWGYNVGPRGNSSFLPKIKLEDTESSINPGYGGYLDGADRKPDAQYVKAGLLERIQYPTGGFTSFEYECNRVYSLIDYYNQNAQVSNTVEWSESTFDSRFSINLSGRIDENAVIHFMVTEYDPRPVPDPNDPQFCFQDMQDLHTIRFEITSTDAVVSTYFETTYDQLLSDKAVSFALPLNKIYRIKCIYDTNDACSYQFPFKVTAYASFLIPQPNKLAGGARIKKITSDNGAGSTIIKAYSYDNPDGTSSATLNVIPDYGYSRFSVDENAYNQAIVYTKHLRRSCEPVQTLTYFNGAPIIYTRVLETESDGSLTERQYDPIYSVPGVKRYPYLPVIDFPNLSGLLTKQIVKDNNNVTKTEQTITYNKFQTRLLNDENRNLKTGSVSSANAYNVQYYVADHYYPYISRAEEATNETKQFENGKTLTTTETKTYDPDIYYLRTKVTTNSKNEQRRQSLTYVYDESGTVYTYMQTKNMIGYVTGTTYQKLDVLNGMLSQEKTNYQLWQSGVMPQAKTMQSSLLDNTLATDITFDYYDDKGNILQYTAKDGVINSFVWGYHQQYPVAKIIGKSYAAAISQSGLNLSIVNEPASDDALRTELNRLRALSGCLISTLSYQPLVGTTSETAPNGIVTYYEYDVYNRLTLVRDKDNNVLKKICYNYTGQPAACGFGTTAAWQSISSACEISAGVLTGNKIVLEKDMNPNSSTYNQTRSMTISNDATCVCTGPDKKIIGGVCETGIRSCTSSVLNHLTNLFTNTYHYTWSDLLESVDYEEISDTSCFLHL